MVREARHSQVWQRLVALGDWVTRKKELRTVYRQYDQRRSGRAHHHQGAEGKRDQNHFLSVKKRALKVGSHGECQRGRRRWQLRHDTRQTPRRSALRYGEKANTEATVGALFGLKTQKELFPSREEATTPNHSAVLARSASAGETSSSTCILSSTSAAIAC